MAPTARTRASRKYNEENYDRVEFTIPKGGKAAIDAAAKKAGYDNRSEYIKAALEAFMGDRGESVALYIRQEKDEENPRQ